MQSDASLEQSAYIEAAVRKALSMGAGGGNDAVMRLKGEVDRIQSLSVQEEDSVAAAATAVAIDRRLKAVRAPYLQAMARLAQQGHKPKPCS